MSEALAGGVAGIKNPVHGGTGLRVKTRTLGLANTRALPRAHTGHLAFPICGTAPRNGVTVFGRTGATSEEEGAGDSGENDE